MTDKLTRASRGAWLIAACLLLVQLLLLASSYPLADAISGKIAWHIDSPYHLYQVELGRSLLKEGALTGLDPFFGGGYRGGVSYNVSARLPVLVGGLLPNSVPTEVIYSLYVLLSALLAPLAVLVMAWQLRWPLVHTAFTAAIGLAFWWIGPMRWFHSAGMVSFVCASYLSVAYGAWVWNICNRGAIGVTWRSAVVAGAAGGLGIWLHPLFGFMVAPWFLALLIAKRKPVEWRALLANAGLIAAIAVVLNVPWLLAMMGLPNIANESPYQKSVGLMVGLKPLMGIWANDSMGSFLNPLVVLAGGAGMLWHDKGRLRWIARLFGVGLVFLLFAAFGALNPNTAILQPNRFVAPAFLFFGLGAAWSLGELSLRLRCSGRAAPRLLATAAGLLFVAYVGREIYREAKPGLHGHYGVATTELTATPALVDQLEAWIRANTSADGRILFETSLGRIHGGGHAAGMIALATGRELIGAPYPYSLPEVSFWDNAGFGVPIGELGIERFAHGLDYYNVGWIIAHSPRLIALAERSGLAESAAQFGPIRIFTIRRPLSFVASGSGRVVARAFNKIEVAGASAPELTLRYNWMPGLVATPRAVLEPALVEPGMPPMIRVIAPPPNFSISICARCAKD